MMRNFFLFWSFELVINDDDDDDDDSDIAVGCEYKSCNMQTSHK